MPSSNWKSVVPDLRVVMRLEEVVPGQVRGDPRGERVETLLLRRDHLLEQGFHVSSGCSAAGTHRGLWETPGRRDRERAERTASAPLRAFTRWTLVPAALLGRVERLIGVEEELLAIHRVFGLRDAAGHGDAEGTPRELEALALDGRPDPLGDRARRGAVVSGKRTANSSPPYRQAMSELRIASRTISPKRRMAASPAPWPRESFNALNRSRSKDATARSPPYRSRRAHSSARRVSK